MQANMEESTVSTSTVTDNVASTSQNLVQSQSTEDDPEGSTNLTCSWKQSFR